MVIKYRERMSGSATAQVKLDYKRRRLWRVERRRGQVVGGRSRNPAPRRTAAPDEEDARLGGDEQPLQRANELCWRVSGTTTANCGDTPPTGAVTYTYGGNGDLVSSKGGLAATYNVVTQTTDFKPTTAGANATFEYAGQGQKERTKKNSALYLDSVLGVSAEKPGSDYRGFVRDNSGALVGTRVPEGNPVVKKRYYYLRDALGSGVAVTNDQGTVVRRHIYGDPYGEDVSNDEIVTGAPSNPYRFAGEYLDTETSLYKIGERYYDPALARWTQKDPMTQAFSPREANGYSYVGGDPANMTDPGGTNIFGDAWDYGTRDNPAYEYGKKWTLDRFIWGSDCGRTLAGAPTGSQCDPLQLINPLDVEPAY